MAKQQKNSFESEEQIISLAQSAVSQCNWVVGECAAAWTEKYAKGRTDADFGAMVGLSSDQVFQRRRVAETFGDVHDSYPSLKWSHFYVALTWDDAPECLQWAEENDATVAEMKAWRRAIKGEDLTTEAEVDDWGGDPHAAYVPTEASPVLDPDSFGSGTGRGNGGPRQPAGDSPELVSAVAREADGNAGDYSPYRSGAATPPPKESGSSTAVAEKPQVSAEQLLKRLTTTMERMNKALTDEMLEDMKKQPQKKRDRLVKAVGEISSKTARLM